ncbi:MAG TPA: acyl-CoA carboxylase subunit epsilon [Mycobacteriales bacterium]|nr:acyl-CoA carboxylase subunit epsilon [Mycobacteriales bacterium]
MSQTPGAEPDPPPVAVVRVVRGDPTPEELAALVTVLTTVAAGAPAARPTPAGSGWGDRGSLLRRPLHPGPGAWRASALPPR